MKGSKYIISIKIADNMIFSSENRKKEVTEWVNTYEENKTIEEIKIYQKNKVEKSYTLLYSDCRRKIGF